MALPRSRVTGEFCLNLFDVMCKNSVRNHAQWHLTKPGTTISMFATHAHRTLKSLAKLGRRYPEQFKPKLNAPSAWRSQGQSVSKHPQVDDITASGATRFTTDKKWRHSPLKSSRVCPGIFNRPQSESTKSWRLDGIIHCEQWNGSPQACPSALDKLRSNKTTFTDCRAALMLQSLHPQCRRFDTHNYLSFKSTRAVPGHCHFCLLES